MSDLISRSKVISVLEQLYEHSLNGKMDISNAIYLLENHPTAYDVGKVVEEFEKASKDVSRGYLGKDNNKYHKHYKAVRLSRAIEIVKQGGVSDDVCEWKQTSTSKYKTSCGYKVEEYFDTNACYCKQCGKKIKVVE